MRVSEQLNWSFVCDGCAAPQLRELIQVCQNIGMHSTRCRNGTCEAASRFHRNLMTNLRSSAQLMEQTFCSGHSVKHEPRHDHLRRFA